jgi:hypothetical protein
MEKKTPRFRIFAVKDGDVYGLLVKRQLTDDQPEEQRYFWFRDPEGLAPTQEIMRACNQCHELRSSVYEKRLIKELVDYASIVDQTGNLMPVKSVAGKYYEAKGYQGLVDHFFGRVDSPLRDFFVDADTFKTAVLAKVRGKDEIVGRAAEFGVRSPHNIPHGDFPYLKPIEHILKVGTNEPPKWFRKQGPIAVDFHDGRVYRRAELLNDLKNLVLSNQFSILDGTSATGKTVLVRQLGYELREEKKMVVYYFDCDLYRDFDKERLIEEINSTRGVIILENIHLATQQYQRIYSLVRSDPQRHILFTSRPSFREAENEKDTLLSTISTLELEPFNQVDRILEHYASHYPGLAWSLEDRESIKRVSRKSFWLLAYALEGYVRANGEGDPMNWLVHGVHSDLTELEKLDPSYPEVLASLSPLYRSEVLTEEFYLTKVLGFSQTTLSELVYRDEITVQRDRKEGYVFYGLPHSALAEAYWEHGKIYRRRRGLPEYREYIYEYARSNVPNGLESVLFAEVDTQKSVLSWLDEAGETGSVLERERFMKVIASWAREHSHAHPIGTQLINILAKKITEDDDLRSSGKCIRAIKKADPEAARALIRALDKERLANRVNAAKNINQVLALLTAIEMVNHQAAARLCRLLSLAEITAQINATQDIALIWGALSCIGGANKKVARAICESIDLPKLIKRLNVVMGPYGWGFINIVRAANPRVARDLCELLDMRALVDKCLAMKNSNYVPPIAEWFVTIYAASKKAGRKFRKLVPQTDWDGGRILFLEGKLVLDPSTKAFENNCRWKLVYPRIRSVKE